MANMTPLAPTLTLPDNNSYIVVSTAFNFTWAFNDPGDVQASASLRYKVPAGAWTTLTDVVTSPTIYTLPGGTLTAGILYEWQVQTKDTVGQWSPWSASRFVNTVTTIGLPTITAPASGAVVSTTPVLVSWTIPAPFTQDSYTVYVTDALGIPYGTRVEEESVTARSAWFPLPILPAGSDPASIMWVTYSYNGLLTSNGVAFTNAVLPPETPLLVLAQVEDRPEVTVSVTNPAPSDAGHLATASFDLLRDGTRIAKDRPPTTTYTDRMPGAGERDYVAVAKTALGGTATSF